MGGETSHHRAAWTLRIAAAAIFAGHGVFALSGKPAWLGFFIPFGIEPGLAKSMMFGVGLLDVALAAVVLVRPIPVLLLWMTVWGLWTAMLRPIVGKPIWDFIERGGNWGVPLALLFLLGWPKSWRSWTTPYRFQRGEQHSPR
jgi:hypothetical protein